MGDRSDWRREAASRGGRAAHARGTAHRFTAEELEAGGRRGGDVVSRDRAHMAEIGRKGGLAVSADRAHMAAIGALGGRPRRGGRLVVAEAAGATHRGRVRATNEDSLAALAETGLGVVADGVGGHPDGEVASALAVAVVTRCCGARGAPVPPVARLRGAIEVASWEVWSRGGRRMSGGMLTTIAAFLVDGEAAVAWVGDSRAYGMISGSFRRLSTDHSVGHRLTRAVGEGPTVVVDALVVDAGPGDVLLACTDGLWGVVPEESIWSAMARAAAPGQSGLAAGALVDEALRAGGPDNVTVAIARLGSSRTGRAGAERSGT